MALKSLVLVTLLAVAAIAVPMAQAQFGGMLGALFGLFRIQGVLYCTPNGNIGSNGIATPVFPNAQLQLQCGGTTVSNTTTNGLGIFSLLLGQINSILPQLSSSCKLVASTPLATCNASLPSVGGLVSGLLSSGTTLIQGLNVTNLIPSGFNFTANIN